MIQIDFWTQITMLSSWPGHVSVSGRSEWKAQSVCVIEARLTHLQRGMLITRAWPGPLWAGRDKKNQFLSCQTLPAPDLRDLLSWRLVFSPGSRRSQSGRRLSFWEKKARRTGPKTKRSGAGWSTESPGLCATELKWNPLNILSRSYRRREKWDIGSAVECSHSWAG